jgi:hypothetical protein
MHVGAKVQSPYQLSSPQFGEITRDAQELLSGSHEHWQGCTVWQTERPRDPIHVHPHSGAIGGRLPHGSSELLHHLGRALHRGWTVITC